MSKRIDDLKLLIERNEKCRAVHVHSEVVKEFYEGEREPIWEGVVETFQLEGHPTAKRAYAWMRGQMANEPKREPQYTYVLGVPPINTAQHAIQAGIVAKLKAKLREI